MFFKYLLLALLGAFYSATSCANDSVIDYKQSYFVDTSSSLGIQEIEKKPFKPYKNTLHLGFQHGNVWLKLELPNQQPSDNPKVVENKILVISPFILEKIDIYQASGHNWSVQTGGSMTPLVNRICPYGMHCFNLSGNDSENGNFIYLKLQHTGYITVKSEITTLSALSKLTADHTESITFSQSIAFSLFCISLVLLFIDKTSFILTYSILQFTVYLYIFFASGKIFTFFPVLPAENYSLLNYEFINLRVLLTILLIYTFMKDYIVNKIYKLLTNSLITVLVLNFVLIGLGFIKLGIYTYVAVIALNMPVQFYGLSKASRMPSSIFWLLTVSFVVLTSLITYGYINIFTDSEELTSRGAEFIFYTNYRLNGAAFGLVVVLILIIKYYEKMIMSLIRDKDLQLAQETSRINNEKLQERQTLIDVLTHELKNPLSTLKFAAYSLKQSVITDEENAQRTNRINSSLRRIDQLISHVANSNKIDRYQIETEFDQIHAKSLVIQIIEDQLTYPMRFEEKFQIEINPATIFCSNLQMLSLSIENLISNALKYSSPHTQILIKIEETITHHIFSISNYFPLHAKPDAEKLFQRYYRHDAFQPMPGMGLGLTLVKDAAQKSGSEVDFQLENDRITFTLSVPVSKG